MSAVLFYLPFPVAFTSNGVAAPGAKAYFYTTGTSTPLAVYTTSAMTIAHSNPVVADGVGRFANIYLDNTKSYRLVIKSKTGSTLADVDPYIPGQAPDAGSLSPYSDAAAASAAAAQNAAATAIAAAADVDPSLYALITPQLYGAVADGSTDCTTAIQNALNAINGMGGGTLYFPEGTYKVSSYLTVYKKTVIRGAGRKASIITTAAAGGGGTGTDQAVRNGSVFYSNWTSNSSTAVDIAIEHLGITCSNVLNVGAAFYDNGGSYISLRNLTFTGFKYGVVLDQSEMADVDLCDFEGQTTAGAWLVNGADLKAGNSGSFTNRISITRCQINQGVSAYGILDDGGYTHSFVDNNYNGCLSHIRAAGVNGLKISGGEFESAAGACIRFESTSLAATSVGASVSVWVGGGGVLAPAAAQSGIVAVSLANIVLSSVYIGNTSAVKFAGTTNCNAIYAIDVFNGGGGATFDGRATNHFEVGYDGTGFKIRTNLAVDSSANILSTTGLVGYDTGAGGTVTQATNKSTGVTLNKSCGQITMNNAALASAAKVSFVVTNSTITATDVVIANVASGGTANAYRASVSAVGAGVFTITVENITGGSLSEAPVITFAVVNAVSA